MILQLNISDKLGQKFQSLRSSYKLDDEAMVARLVAEYLEDIEDIEAVAESERTKPSTISAADLRAELGL